MNVSLDQDIRDLLTGTLLPVDPLKIVRPIPLRRDDAKVITRPPICCAYVGVLEEVDEGRDG